jgi:hypothetical protein
MGNLALSSACCSSTWSGEDDGFSVIFEFMDVPMFSVQMLSGRYPSYIKIVTFFQ